MNEAIISIVVGFGISAGIGISTALFAKIMPKEKTFTTKIAPVVKKIAIATFYLMRSRLTMSDIKKVEEGIFKTLSYWIDSSIHLYTATIDEMIFKDTKK